MFDAVINVGDNWQTAINAGSAGDSFGIEPGTHDDQKINPKDNQSFYGPRVIMDGSGTKDFAIRATSNASGVHVEGITAEDYVPGAQNGMFAIGTGGGWTVRKCELRESSHLGMVFNGNNNKILNCFIHHNHQSNLKGFANDNLVEGCEISYGNWLGEFPGGGEGGGTKFLDSTRLTLRNNWVHDNVNGLWCDFDNDQTVYEDNLVEGNSNKGIFQEYGYNAIIRNNTVRNNGRGIDVTSCDNAEVYGNTVTEDETWMWGVERDHTHTGRFGLFRLRDLWVHHNTVVLTGGARHGIRDNIDATPNVYGEAANNLFDYNDYTDDGAPAAPFFWETNAEYTWAQWQTAGNDPNGSFTS